MFDELLEPYEESLRRLTDFERRQRKRAIRRAHKGTNWKTVKPRKGFKRYKLPGTKRYIIMRLSTAEKSTKKILGRRLGKASYLK